MSVRYLAWALDLETLDAAHKMVLVVLANRANDDGECWPGQQSIGRQASMSESTVRRKLLGLENAGYISRIHRPGVGGGRSTDMYVLDMQATGQIDRMQATGQSDGGNRSKSPRQPVTGGHIEPSVEPSVETSVSPYSPPAPRIDFDTFWAEYPRRTGKGAARKAFERAVKKADPSMIMSGCRRFAADPNRDAEFTPHPATWLNQERWDDDPLPPRTGGKTTPTQRALSGLSAMLGEDHFELEARP